MPRIEATHFIEVWKGENHKTHNTNCLEIGILKRILLHGEIFHIETIAIWKIKFKKN